MKIQLLPTSFDGEGRATQEQHLCCFLINDCVAVDAGSLAMATTSQQKKNIRDVVLSHAHLDHIAGLPIFLDDLFAALEMPLRVHAEQKVIDVLEENIFNWDVYPRFSELQNDFGQVLVYCPFESENAFKISDLTFAD